MRHCLPLSTLLQRRALALALGLLLLLTQQVGLHHLLSHALGAPGAAAAALDGANGAAPGEADRDGGQPADSLCQVCLALAALGLAALPATWRWLAPRLPAATPAPRPAPGRTARAASPYLARAPPALQAPI